jgi:hypothetical protein
MTASTTYGFGAIRVYENLANALPTSTRPAFPPALLFRLDLNALHAINSQSRFWKRDREHPFLE